MIKISRHSHYSSSTFYHQTARNVNKIVKKNINISVKSNKRKNVKCLKKRSNSKKDIKKRLHFGTMINEFLKNSSMYILKRIGNSKSMTQKAFWFVILIIGLVGCLSQSVQFLLTYYSYPVVVNLESMKPNYLAFPAVTICNINSYRRKFEACVNQSLTYEKCVGINETDTSKVFRSHNITLPECKEILETLNTISSKKTHNWAYLVVSQSYASRIQYGHQFKNFIQTCVYNGWNCDAKDFKLSASFLYGNCYTFNFEKHNILSTEPGPKNGLLLELDLEVNKYLSFTQRVGAIVEIHDSNVIQNVESRGHLLRPGYETHIAVTQSTMSRLPSPYKDHCRKYKLGDSKDNCYDLCAHIATISACSCGSRSQKDVLQCDYNDPLTVCCLLKLEGKGYPCDCPLSCEDVVYNLQISSHLWPTKTYHEEKQKLHIKTNATSIPLPLHEFRKNNLRLLVYFDTFDFTIYKQNALYKNSEIFSQVGGQMSLWLGLSCMYFFECLEGIILFCRSLLID